MDADFRLLSQMKRGEEEAIECFVRKYYPSILQYCHYHLQEIHDAEDLTQETFARFFASWTDTSTTAKRPTISMSLPGTCAGTITVGSRNSPCRPARTGGPPAGHPGHPPGPAGRLSRPAVGDSARRGALFLQERKQREIAKILGIGLPLVKYRIRKARELLAQFLRKEAP
ncbi:MAG: RNA polymerase sigma factor [Evtepia gabavorous]